MSDRDLGLCWELPALCEEETMDEQIDFQARMLAFQENMMAVQRYFQRFADDKERMDELVHKASLGDISAAMDMTAIMVNMEPIMAGFARVLRENGVAS